VSFQFPFIKSIKIQTGHFLERFINGFTQNFTHKSYSVATMTID